jgi:hypothetical protein
VKLKNPKSVDGDGCLQPSSFYQQWTKMGDQHFGAHGVVGGLF